MELLQALVLRGPRLPSGSGPCLSPAAAAAAAGVTVGAMAEAAVQRGYEWWQRLLRWAVVASAPSLEGPKRGLSCQGFGGAAAAHAPLLGAL